MSATIESPRSGRIAPQYRRHGGSKGNFEMIAWLFMRLSGVVLVVLMFWDLAMLWLAMLHGTNGVRTIINDYAEKDSTRRWLKTVLYSATVVIIVRGTLVIFTFDPCPVVDGVPLPGGFCPA